MVDEQILRAGLTGNLCRCTGYEGIVQAGLRVNQKKLIRVKDRWADPLMTRALQKAAGEAVQIISDEHALLLPNTMQALLEARKVHPEATIVAGATDLGVLVNKARREISSWIGLGKIGEMSGIQKEPYRLIVGARVTLSAFEQEMENTVPAVARFLKLFASPQIKNSGTLVGNIANGSPIGDSLPFLCVMNAELEIASVHGVRMVNINDFFKGYKTFDLSSEEVIVRVHLPLPSANEHLALYKVSKRRHLDISTVSAVFLLRKEKDLIKSFRVAFGGVAATPIRLKVIEDSMVGKPLNAEVFRAAGERARGLLKPLTDVRGSRVYREMLVGSLFEKFFAEWRVLP